MRCREMLSCPSLCSKCHLSHGTVLAVCREAEGAGWAQSAGRKASSPAHTPHRAVDSLFEKTGLHFDFLDT